MIMLLKKTLVNISSTKVRKIFPTNMDVTADLLICRNSSCTNFGSMNHSCMTRPRLNQKAPNKRKQTLGPIRINPTDAKLGYWTTKFNFPTQL